MKKFILVLLLSTTIITAASPYNAFGSELYADSFNELENVLIEQMSSYSQHFVVRYTGSLDNIEDNLKNSVKKDPYINSNVKSMGWKMTSSSKACNIDFNVDYIITPTKRTEADKKIKAILGEIISPYMNDHEKVKAVHDYIVLNGKYDNTMQYYSDYDLLTHGTSVCNGYALLTYNMLNELNIPVKLISGTAKGELHIWNMVKLGDYWFHLDTTWDDPVPDANIVSYNYYMLSDEEILKDHKIDESLNFPKATKKYYEYLKELSFDKLLMETGLDVYTDKNTAKTEKELVKILETKIKYHPLKISVRINKDISQDNINNALSGLLNDLIPEIFYDKLDSDSTDEYYILNLFIKYNKTPDSLSIDLSDKVYNTATTVKFNAYAIYGNKKVNITDSILIYPNDSKDINVYNGTLIFNRPGNFNIKFEYQGLQEDVSVTALNAGAFEYITDKKPDRPVNVKVYDQYIDFSTVNQWPFIENGRTMVPLRAIFEVMNCKVRWDESSNSAIIEYEGTKIIVPANINTIFINGKESTLDVPAKIIKNRIMVPLRFISEAIDKKVIWDDAEKTVLIY